MGVHKRELRGRSMGTLQKLKAYFGMVPAEDFDEYDADDTGYLDGRTYGHRPGYLSDEDDYEPYPAPRRRLLGGQRYDDDAQLDGPDQDYRPPASRPRSRPV